MKDYLEIILSIDPSEEELASGILSQFEQIESLQMTDQGLKAYTRQSAWPLLKEALAEVLKNFQWSFTTKLIKAKNWNEEWEKNFNPIAVDDLVWIRADFHEPNSAYRDEIVINPRNAFGTGHHETTFLMIQEMASMNWSEKSCLDFGTGTGILSIWAHQLGCRQITAIDNTPEAVENTVMNFQINKVPPEDFIVKQGSFESVGSDHFDVILANINRHVLEQYSKELIAALEPNGHLYLSGILRQDQEMILELYKSLQIVSVKGKGDWMCIHLKK